MESLRKLLAPKDVAPKYGRETECPEPIDWQTVEDRLERLATAVVAEFAQAHAGETFYGLGFDCNSETGETLICLNTTAGLPSDDPWGFGDWRYHGINLESTAWTDGWAEIEDRMAGSVNTLLNNRQYEAFAALREAFLVMAARAVLRVEQSEAVASLSRTADFRVLCADHDESAEKGFERLRQLGYAP